MQLYHLLFAKKYAVAFNNLYGSSLELKDLENCQKLAIFFANNRYCYMVLGMPSLSWDVKKEALDIILNNFDLKKEFMLLAYALLKQGKIEFLDKVLWQLYHEYNRRHGIELFKITSSHTLSQQQKNIIKAFVQSLNKHNVLTKFEVDQKLIVGVRVQSATLLWERSIRKELTEMSSTIAQKGMP